MNFDKKLWPYNPTPKWVWIDTRLLSNSVALDERKSSGISVNKNGDLCYSCGKRLKPGAVRKFMDNGDCHGTKN